MIAEEKAVWQFEILTRGVEEIVPEPEFREKLERSARTGKPLRVKLGIDPTTPYVHIGHMVPFGKLRQFQDLGHTAVIIIGDYTAAIGDPSGRNSERPPLTHEQVQENAQTYTQQIFRVVDKATAEVRWQSEWFNDLKLAEILKLSGIFSIAQLLAHETFRKRYEQGIRVGLNELVYPVLQAYDSLAVDADIELGGTDQKFNLLAGRDLLRAKDREAQVAMLLPLLPGLDGEKMSKSAGNDIRVSAQPFEQFSRIMAIKDEDVSVYWRLVLMASEQELRDAAGRLSSGENPMSLKMEVAEKIVARFNGEVPAMEARHAWERQFSRKEIPEDMDTVMVERAETLLAVFKLAGMIESSSEGIRLFREGAVKLDGETVRDVKCIIDPALMSKNGHVVKLGKRRWLKLLKADGMTRHH